MASFSQKWKKALVKFVWSYKGSPKAKTILRKNKAGEITIPRFQTILKNYSNQNSKCDIKIDS